MQFVSKILSGNSIHAIFNSDKNFKAFKGPVIMQFSIVTRILKPFKGPVKLIEWVKIAILLSHVTSKAIPVYDFKLVWVVLHPSVKELFRMNCQQEQNNNVLFKESIWLTLKFHSFIPPNGK